MSMKPPYTITPLTLTLVAEITRYLGRIEGMNLTKPEPQLRRANRVRTIQASLAIEGNTLALDQVTAILDGKRVLGSTLEVREVQNAIRTYDQITKFKPHSAKSLLSAHKSMMEGLIPNAGHWRNQNVGVFQGSKVAHAAPQAKRVPLLMDQLFDFVKTERTTHPLITSAIFHYELEFIHPFSDGNGRIGRLWQTALLTRYHPIFEFTPIETFVRERQPEYYASLGASDKSGTANPFIEFSLGTVLSALESLSQEYRPVPLTAAQRLDQAKNVFSQRSFTRKEYLALLKSIGSATASRDLAWGVKARLLTASGSRALTSYRFA